MYQTVPIRYHGNNDANNKLTYPQEKAISFQPWHDYANIQQAIPRKYNKVNH